MAADAEVLARSQRVGKIQHPGHPAAIAGRILVLLGGFAGGGQRLVGPLAQRQRAGEVEIEGRVVLRQRLLIDAPLEDLGRLGRAVAHQQAHAPGQQHFSGLGG